MHGPRATPSPAARAQLMLTRTLTLTPRLFPHRRKQQHNKNGSRQVRLAQEGTDHSFVQGWSPVPSRCVFCCLTLHHRRRRGAETRTGVHAQVASTACSRGASTLSASVLVLQVSVLSLFPLALVPLIVCASSSTRRAAVLCPPRRDARHVVRARHCTHEPPHDSSVVQSLTR